MSDDKPDNHNQALMALMGEYAERIEQAMDARIPPASTHPARLHEAMRYACLGGGKRIRPFLVYATGNALGVALEQLDGPACSVEMIHAYSLVHDDLPAMDDDDLRRGRPTLHKAFDEGMAILAGDALNTLAFQILAHDADMVDNADQRLRMVEILGTASGSRGMAGGQAIDLAAEGKTLTIAEIEDMHIHKTGALLRASVLMGAHSADTDEQTVDKLDHYAKCIGLAFQIQDDILDVVGDTETLGKQAGADAALNKPTFPGAIGLAASRERAQELCEQGIESIASLDERGDPLRWIAQYIISRAH